jgi:hypothetical protein
MVVVYAHVQDAMGTSHQSLISHLAGTGTNHFEIRLSLLSTRWKGPLRLRGNVSAPTTFASGVA